MEFVNFANLSLNAHIEKVDMRENMLTLSAYTELTKALHENDFLWEVLFDVIPSKLTGNGFGEPEESLARFEIRPRNPGEE